MASTSNRKPQFPYEVRRYARRTKTGENVTWNIINLNTGRKVPGCSYATAATAQSVLIAMRAQYRGTNS